MARKVRTPPPPKRVVQAPKRRATPPDDTRNRKVLYVIGASGFVLLGAVLAFFLFFSGDDDAETQRNAQQTLRAAGWTYRKAPSQGRTHVPQLEPSYKYNTVPATSGNHSNQTVIYGPYDQPVSEFNYVHNLEHGAIGIMYGEQVPPETVTQILEYYNADPNGLIVAPDPRLNDQIAMTAWTHIAKGKTFSEELADTFVDAFGFRGPESCKSDIEQGCFRRSNMEPGNP